MYTPRKNLCLKFKNAEKCLQRHTQDAIEDKHIGPLVDKHTNLFTHNVLTTMNYLFHEHGKVRLEEVSIKEHEIMSITWQTSETIALLTRTLENLQKL